MPKYGIKFFMASNKDALVLFFFFSSSNNLNNFETTFNDGSFDCSDSILIVFIIDKYMYNKKPHQLYHKIYRNGHYGNVGYDIRIYPYIYENVYNNG